MAAEQTITRWECAMCGRGFSDRTADDSPHFSTIGDETVICPGPIAVERTYFAEDVIREWIEGLRIGLADVGADGGIATGFLRALRRLEGLLDDLTTGGKTDG